MQRKLIGQSMLEARLLNKMQIDWILERQKYAAERVLFGKLTVELDILTEKELAFFLASYFGLEYVNLEEYEVVQKDALDALPERIARRLNALPLARKNSNLTVAISDPLDLTTIENLEAITRCRIRPVISSPIQIRYAIDTMYRMAKEK